MTPLADGKLIKEKYYGALFPDISTILGLNMNLLNALKQKFDNWDNDKSVIGDEFVKFAPYFKMYQNYVNNHEQAARVLHGLEQQKSFQEFCNAQQTNPKAKGLTLASFLILPIQRVPRYELCLRVMFCSLFFFFFIFFVSLIFCNSFRYHKQCTLLILLFKLFGLILHRFLKNEAKNVFVFSYFLSLFACICILQKKTKPYV